MRPLCARALAANIVAVSVCHVLSLVTLIELSWPPRVQELQSPLDVFAAKYCTVRSRLYEGGELIPEGDGDEEDHWRLHASRRSLDGQATETSGERSPLSALLQRQFPNRAETEKRLFS